MENKYKKWYNNIVLRAKTRQLTGYSESHHIIPKSLGGKDELTNLVRLTAREHFICHILLVKFTTGINKSKMIRAVMFMKSSNSQQQRYINSRLYEKTRIMFSEQQKLRMSGENNSYYGKTHSIETRKKISLAKKGKHNNSWNTGLSTSTSEKLQEVGRNISKSKKGVPSKRKGLPGPLASEEAKAKMRAARQGNSFWWNNGVKNVRAAECPGNEWKRGRLMSPSLYASFCKKITE